MIYRLRIEFDSNVSGARKFREIESSTPISLARSEMFVTKHLGTNPMIKYLERTTEPWPHGSSFRVREGLVEQ